MPRITSRRRKKKISGKAHRWWAHLLFSAAWGVIVAGVLWLLQRAAPALAGAILARLDKAASTLAEVIFGKRYHLWPLYVQGGILTFFGVWTNFLGLGLLWSWFYDRLLTPLDADVVAELPDVKPFDPLFGSGAAKIDELEPVMPFHLPKQGRRREVWDELDAVVRTGCSDGRKNLRKAPTHDPDSNPFLAFRFLLLTGRPGTGKTRMAVDYLLKLERRDEVATMGRLRRGFFRAGVWWRNTWPSVKRLPNDPWDVGWIRPEMMPGGDSYEERRQVSADTVHALQGWHPRRPTAFLLDDPFEGDVKRVVDALSERKRQYRFPVRLVVVSQSGSTELGVDLDMGQDLPSNAAFSGVILELDEHCEVTATEIEWMAREAKLPPGISSRWRDTNRDTGLLAAKADELYTIAGGNAMLVEMGFHHMVTSLALAGLNGADLVAKRAERVRRALINAYGEAMTQTRLLVLASTTLAGGLDEKEAAVGRDTAEYEKVLAVIAEDLRGLRRCFGLAHREELPVIRPRCLGDAFARRVLESERAAATEKAKEKAWERQLAVVHRAWRLSPQGTMATVARVGADTHELGRALRCGPPEGALLDAYQMAEAYATAACLQSKDQPSPGDRGAAATKAAQEAIRRLTPADGVRLLGQLTATLDSGSGMVEVRAPAVAICSVDCVRVLVEGEPLPAEAMLPVMNQVARGYVDVWLPLFAEIQGLRVAANDVLQRFAQYAGGATGLRSRAFALAYSTLCGIVVHIEASTGQKESCFAALDEVLSTADTEAYRGDRPFDLLRAQSWQNVCYLQCSSRDGDACLAALKEVLNIAETGSYRGDRDFDLERARAWESVCGVESTRNFDACLAALREVLEIASTKNYRGDRDFDLQRARAWRHGCYLQSSRDAEACLAALGEVLAIANTAGYPGLLPFDLQRVKAWKHVCYLQSSRDSDACLTALRELLKIATVERYRGEPDFDLERAMAWRHVSYLQSRRDAVAWRAAAKEVLAITDCPAYRGDRRFDQERTIAWRHLCFWHSVQGNRPLCRAALEEVTKIAQLPRYKDDASFQEEHAEAERALSLCAG